MGFLKPNSPWVYKRRRFCLLFLFSALAISCTITPKEPSTSPFYSRLQSHSLKRFAAIQGLTTSQATQISFLLPQDLQVQYFIRNQKGRDEISLQDYAVKVWAPSFSKWKVENLTIEKLSPKSVYTIELRSRDGEILDSREFKTLDENKSLLRMAALSNYTQASSNDLAANGPAANDIKKHELSAASHFLWKSILNQNPDFILLLGTGWTQEQKVFHSTPQKIWAHHIKARLALGLSYSPQLVPLLGVWGPDEYGSSQNREFQFRSESADYFKVFYGQEGPIPPVQFGPGTSRLIPLSNLSLAITDPYYFRLQNKNAAESEWGPAQENWLINELQSRKKPAWIIGHRSTSLGETTMNSLQRFTYPFIFLGPSLEEMTIQSTQFGHHSTFYIHTGAFNRSSGEPGQYLLIETENKKGALHAHLRLFDKYGNEQLQRFLSVRIQHK